VSARGEQHSGHADGGGPWWHHVLLAAGASLCAISRTKLALNKSMPSPRAASRLHVLSRAALKFTSTRTSHGTGCTGHRCPVIPVPVQTGSGAERNRSPVCTGPGLQLDQLDRRPVRTGSGPDRTTNTSQQRWHLLVMMMSFIGSCRNKKEERAPYIP
jgi:hypothetical protein